MIRWRQFFLVSLTAFGVGGCYAGIKAYEVTNEADAPGLRYFLTTPYLIIEEQPNDRWTARLELGVDRSREFAVQPYTILAKSTATVDFHEDGTLKSFKLEQDTTKIPEAVVNALKDIQLKRIELEKAALDRRLKEAEAEGEAAKGKAALLREGAVAAEVGAETRKVYIFRVAGTRAIAMDAVPAAEMKVPSPAQVGITEAPAGTLTALSAVIEEGNLVIAGTGRGLGQTDIRDTHFIKADGQVVPDDVASTLRRQMTVQSQKLVIPVGTLRTASVKRVAIGTAEATVP